MKKKILVGIDDFKEAIEEEYRYVDKTLLVSELLESSKVVAITRPRRFGKTLNMSMLSYFFDVENREKNRELFKGLAIEKSKYFNEHMGRYPVIFLSFKQVKSSNWDLAFDKIKGIIKQKYLENKFLLDSEHLEEEEKKYFKSILSGEASIDNIEESLVNLSRFMHKYHKEAVIILVDEYDTPMIEGELKGYFEEVSEFMERLLGGAFKGNSDLYKGVMTGITRLQGAGIFSGLNNVEVCTVLDRRYRDKFGFTEEEVSELLKEYEMEDKEKSVREHYNGYNFRGEVIYNPYSVVRCIDINEIENFWLGSSSNDLAKKKLKELMEMGEDREIRKRVEELLQGRSIEIAIKNGIEISDDMMEEEILNLLLAAGYLKYENYESRKIGWYAEVSIPNREVEGVYMETLREWLGRKYTRYELVELGNFLKEMCEGGEEEIKKRLENFLENRSMMDGFSKEMSYHNFMFGMLQGLIGEYEVESNRESGEGRYDIRLTPISGSKEGIVVEFKIGEKDKLKELSAKAVEQIEKQGYHKGFKVKGIKRARLVGIAFHKKKAEVTLKEVDL